MIQKAPKAFKNSLTEVSLLFHQASISLFTDFNTLLQSDKPLIHIVHHSVINLGKKLGNRIIEASVMRESCITDIDLADQSIYLCNESTLMVWPSFAPETVEWWGYHRKIKLKYFVAAQVLFQNRSWLYSQKVSSDR